MTQLFTHLMRLKDDRKEIVCDNLLLGLNSRKSRWSTDIRDVDCPFCIQVIEGDFASKENINLFDTFNYTRKAVVREDVSATVSSFDIPDEFFLCKYDCEKLFNMKSDPTYLFTKSFLQETPEFFIYECVDGTEYFVNTQGYDYMRYVVEIEEEGDEPDDEEDWDENFTQEVNKEHDIDQLEEAIEKLNEAYEIISNVVNGDLYTQAYLLDSLSHMANNDGNPYNLSVPQIIEDIRKDPEKFSKK